MRKVLLSAGAIILALPADAGAQLQVTIHPEYKVTIDDKREAQHDIDAVAGNTTFADAEQWQGQRNATLKDITDYLPGVIDQPRNGAESSRLSIRGSGLANTFQGRGLLVLQDGIPINMADGEFEFPVIDPWLIRYAEVFPGANALEYGSSALGGAINLVTPTGSNEEGANFRGETGSFSTLHGQAAVGQRWKAYDAYTSATAFSQGGFRDHNGQQTGRFNSNLGWQENASSAHRIYVSHTHSDAEIPGALSLSELRNDSHAVNPVNQLGDYQRNLDITRIAEKSIWQSGLARLETAVFYTYRTLDNPVTTYEFQHNNDMGLRLKYSHQHDADQWLLGANLYYGNADETRYQNNRGVPGARLVSRDLDAVTSEAYGQYDKRILENLHGLLGFQTSYVTRDIAQSFPFIASQTKQYAGISPRLGVRYDIDTHMQGFTNISRSFEPPSWGELSGGNNPGFNTLKAQTATTFEIGGRGDRGEIHWQAAYYHSALRNEFVNYRFTDGATATINAARTTHDGIELGVNGEAATELWQKEDALIVRANYTFGRFTLDNDPIYRNHTLPGVPEHYLRAETLYRTPLGIALGPNVEWVPKAPPVDLANSLYADSYALLGARVSWENVRQTVSFYAEIRNVMDKNYVATTNVVPDAGGRDGRYFYPGEGRAFYTGVQVRL